MKKVIFIVALLFLLIGAVSAAENITGDADDTLSVDDAGDVIETPDKDTLDEKDTKTLEKTETQIVNANESTTPVKEKPTITTQSVTGKQGKTITLKATVKNSTGPVKGLKVTFTLNGKTYTATTDAKGVASYKVKCPKSAVADTTTKTKGKKMTKTTTYSKTYSAAASADGAKSTFKVVSTKAKVVKKYKIIKKKKTLTVKFKKGTKTLKKGNYAVITTAKTESGLVYFGAAIVGKNEQDYIKFYIKEHYKQKGKWKWESWYKVPKGKIYTNYFPTSIKVDKIKVKYTQVSYKKIK